MLVSEFVNAFHRRTISAADWTHGAHLAVGLWHISEFSFHDAMCRMRAGIILLNQVHDTPNTGQRGYHETLTWFWLRILELWFTQHKIATLDEAHKVLLAHPVSSSRLPFRFYTECEIKSESTRATLLLPTKRELNWEALEEVASEPFNFPGQ